MSFGLKISFGRLCRLEKLRRESFGDEEPVVLMDRGSVFNIDDYISNSTEYREDIWAIQLPNEETDSYKRFLELYYLSCLERICNASLIEDSSI